MEKNKNNQLFWLTQIQRQLMQKCYIIWRNWECLFWRKSKLETWDRQKIKTVCRIFFETLKITSQFDVQQHKDLASEKHQCTTAFNISIVRKYNQKPRKSWWKRKIFRGPWGLDYYYIHKLYVIVSTYICIVQNQISSAQVSKLWQLHM